MVILAFMGKLIPGQELHLDMFLKPNWVRSEVPLNNMSQNSMCQELK